GRPLCGLCDMAVPRRPARRGRYTDHVALAGGVRHYFSLADTSPFVGMGMGIEYVNVDHADGAGLAFYGELGLDLLRTNQFGGSFSLRCDAPTFSISPGSGHSGPHYYTPIIGAGFAMRF